MCLLSYDYISELFENSFNASPQLSLSLHLTWRTSLYKISPCRHFVQFVFTDCQHCHLYCHHNFSSASLEAFSHKHWPSALLYSLLIKLHLIDRYDQCGSNYLVTAILPRSNYTVLCFLIVCLCPSLCHPSHPSFPTFFGSFGTICPSNWQSTASKLSFSVNSTELPLLLSITTDLGTGNLSTGSQLYCSTSIGRHLWWCLKKSSSHSNCWADCFSLWARA